MNADALSLVKHIFSNIGELVSSGIFLTACPNLEMMLTEVQYNAVLLIFFMLYVVWNKKSLRGCKLLNWGLIYPMEQLRTDDNDVDDDTDDDDSENTAV